ncbi:MAG: phage antirepressor [Lachnospiraceae bacterium]|nr:phage antirepressor [Lachnospiraceae bacterium]
MNELQIFTYNNAQVRTVKMNGEPWFVLKDVCDVLGLTNSRMIAERLDDDEKGVSQIYTPGGKQEMTVINESGLYNVILRSDKPEAKPFRKWVTSEVLPSIRKTGSYSIQQKPDSYMIEDPIERAKRWIEEKEDYLKLKTKIKEDEPKVAFADKVADASNLIDIGQMAKLLNDQNIPIGRNRLFEWLRKEKYLRSNNEPYQKYIDNGIFVVKELTYSTPYGQQVATKTYVTGKGQIFIAETLRKQYATKTA